MDWENTILIILVLTGYFHLLEASKKKSVKALIELNVQTLEVDKYDIPKGFSTFTKSCPLLITPVPGMEFEAAGMVGAEIKKVVMDDQGLIQVMCYLTLRPEEYDFNDACKFLSEDGWYENKH